MLSELEMVLKDVPRGSDADRYVEAIVEDNLTGKRTLSTRRLTAQRLRELYGLTVSVPLFRLMRFYWEEDRDARPLLALLCACARDPLLRITAPAVLTTPEGNTVEKHAIVEVIEREAPGRFKPSTCDKIARNVRSSWTQSGHLTGYSRKVRSHPTVTPAAAAYALLLSYFAGLRGVRLFETIWVRALDVGGPTLHDLALEASRRSWLTYRYAGGIVDVDFAVVLNENEWGVLREQD